MKITTFNPSIITKDGESTIKLFEELGFQQTHNKAENVDVEFSAHRMKNEGVNLPNFAASNPQVCFFAPAIKKRTAVKKSCLFLPKNPYRREVW